MTFGIDAGLSTSRDAEVHHLARCGIAVTTNASKAEQPTTSFGSPRSSTLLDRLLSSLTVRVHAFAIRDIKREQRLAVEPTQFVAIHYILRGFGTIAVEGGESVTFGPNALVVVPIGVAHTLGELDTSAAYKPTTGPCQFGVGRPSGSPPLNESSDVRCASSSIDVTYAGALGLFDALREPIVENVSSDITMRQMFETMLRETSRPTPGTTAIVESLMQHCVILFLRQHVNRGRDVSLFLLALQDARLARAITFVVERPAATHTVGNLAKLAGMSRSAFAERFTCVCGSSPMEFVQRLRLRLAAQLLLATHMPVKSIAENVGYASRSYFTRAFRSVYDIDPLTYRARGGDADALEAVFRLTEPGRHWSAMSPARLSERDLD